MLKSINLNARIAPTGISAFPEPNLSGKLRHRRVLYRRIECLEPFLRRRFVRLNAQNTSQSKGFPKPGFQANRLNMNGLSIYMDLAPPFLNNKD